jgi:hypothetical protein
MTMQRTRSWRWRRCPRCSAVNRAGAFPFVGSYRPGWHADGDLERRCPGCGFIGHTYQFHVVREKHAADMGM